MFFEILDVALEGVGRLGTAQGDGGGGASGRERVRETIRDRCEMEDLGLAIYCKSFVRSTPHFVNGAPHLDALAPPGCCHVSLSRSPTSTEFGRICASVVPCGMLRACHIGSYHVKVRIFEKS